MNGAFTSEATTKFVDERCETTIFKVMRNKEQALRVVNTAEAMELLEELEPAMVVLSEVMNSFLCTKPTFAALKTYTREKLAKN